MKEPSIEQKAKAYDGNYKTYTELISRLEDVKDAIKKQNYGIAMDILYKPYPDFQITASTELKESEDKITWIINYLSNRILNSTIIAEKENLKKAIAYLEKQGEQNLVNTDLDELVIQLEETIGTSPHSRETIKDFFQRAVQKYMNCLKIANGEIGSLVEENYRLKEKQGEQILANSAKTCKDEQKPVFEMKTPEVSLGIDSDTYNKIVDECIYGEQKPADTGKAAKGNDREISISVWSDEDEARFESCIEVLQTSDGYDTINAKWLKSLKDKVQPLQKKEWSEEDEDNLHNCIFAVNSMEWEDKDKQTITNWLKFLRPQSTWKPSDEQMQALSNAGNSFRPFEEGHKILWSLYNDLKKLREE